MCNTILHACNTVNVTDKLKQTHPTTTRTTLHPSYLGGLLVQVRRLGALRVVLLEVMLVRSVVAGKEKQTPDSDNKNRVETESDRGWGIDRYGRGTNQDRQK